MVPSTYAPIWKRGCTFSRDYAGEIRPGVELPLFPVLMPAGWDHRPDYLRRPLLTGSTLRNLPDVATAYLVPTLANGPPQLAWIRYQQIHAIGATPSAFELTALFNLAQRPASWQLYVARDGSRIAACMNDYLAAERILDEAFIAKAERLLGVGGQTLLAGIPERGKLLIARFTNTSADYVFTDMVKRMYEAATNPAITPWTFMVSHGVIRGVLDPRAGLRTQDVAQRERRGR